MQCVEQSIAASCSRNITPYSVRHRGLREEASLRRSTKRRKPKARRRPAQRRVGVVAAPTMPSDKKETIPNKRRTGLRSIAGSLLVMGLGLGFGVAIGLWTESDDEETQALSAAGSVPVVRETSIVSVLGELRARQAVPKLAPPRPLALQQTDAMRSRTAAANNASDGLVPEPPWLRNAVAVAGSDGRPAIAIVIDDAGLNRAGTERLNSLPGPLTVSFITYADDLPHQAKRARAAGHEIFLHVPMAPLSDLQYPGPRALRPEAPRKEIRERLAWALSRVSGYVGVNNHMGSRFTSDEDAMGLLLEELKGRGLAFLDSRTTELSVGETVARRVGLPFAARDVFLDHDLDAAKIGMQLGRLEDIAHRRGYAVAIGHPHKVTLDVLSDWLQTLDARGLILVPVSAIIKRSEADRS